MQETLGIAVLATFVTVCMLVVGWIERAYLRAAPQDFCMLNCLVCLLHFICYSQGLIKQR